MFDRYIALGDSISIDYYPQMDLGIERPIGAASLFFANDDELWPDYAGRDLRHIYPGVEYRDDHDGRFFTAAGDNLSYDGATLFDVRARQLPAVRATEERTIVTLTAGGNDLLATLGDPEPSSGYVDAMIAELHSILGQIKSKLPYSVTLLATVYDPSDGTNVLFGQRLDRHAALLHRFNDAVRSAAKKIEGVRVADIHDRFLGHGTSVPEDERWYWRELIVEPNARGAHEVRKLWLEALAVRV